VLTVGSSVPGFFLGSLLIAGILQFSLYYGPGRGSVIPVQGFGWDAHLIVPVLTLAVRPTLYVANLTAGLVEDELQQDYVRVARSKGVPWRLLVWRHAFPNIRASVIAALGQSLRLIASTLILVEALFDWRGVGWLFLNVIALDRRGGVSPLFMQPELLALVVAVFAVLLLVADLLATVAAYWSDPRLRQGTLQPATI
jgi:peptide/nickel transport system permease protein